MRNDKLTLGFAYLRLSNEEAQGGESSSITNQRMIAQNYCKQNGITLVREFVDDGYSGGNFDRPGLSGDDETAPAGQSQHSHHQGPVPIRP